MKKLAILGILAMTPLHAVAAELQEEPVKMPQLTCRSDTERYLGATLLKSPQYGLIALMKDGYDSTQRHTPGPNGTVWMDCSRDASVIRCQGEWSANQEKTVAIFFRDEAGDTFVTFTRNFIHRNARVTLKCESARITSS